MKNRIMLNAVRMRLIKISKGASGPTPNAIGNGPTKITTPELVEIPCNMEADTKIKTPTKTMIKPVT